MANKYIKRKVYFAEVIRYFKTGHWIDCPLAIAGANGLYILFLCKNFSKSLFWSKKLRFDTFTIQQIWHRWRQNGDMFLSQKIDTLQLMADITCRINRL